MTDPCKRPGRRTTVLRFNSKPLVWPDVRALSAPPIKPIRECTPMIPLPSSVLQVARALLLAIALTAASPAHAQAPAFGLSGVSEEELTRFATSFRSAIESGKWNQVENLIYFPLRVNTGPRQFRLVSKAEFISEYRKVFSPSVREAILAQDADSLQRQWRATSSAGSIVSVEGICHWGNCAKPALRVTAVNLGEIRESAKAE